MRPFGAAMLLAASLITNEARAESRKLTVEDAVQLALQSNPALHEGAAHVRSDRALAASVRGRFLPSVHVTDEFQHWNSSFGIQAFSVRDQNTNTFTAAVDQPLLGLGHTVHEYSAQARTADATELRLEAARSDLRE